MQEPSKKDWIHLPSTSVSVSLWASLHDGELLTICSDLLECTVVLEIDVFHVRDFHKLGDGIRFVVTLQGVESARASSFLIWPGAVPEVQGKSYQEQNRLVEKYQTKGREESVGWNDFVAAFATNVMDIYSAELACDNNTATLHLQGTLNGDKYHYTFFNIFIRAKKIQIRQSNDILLTLEQFIQLGEDYWGAQYCHPTADDGS
jgi:hypothetical protein